MQTGGLQFAERVTNAIPRKTLAGRRVERTEGGERADSGRKESKRVERANREVTEKKIS